MKESGDGERERERGKEEGVLGFYSSPVHLCNEHSDHLGRHSCWTPSAAKGTCHICLLLLYDRE